MAPVGAEGANFKKIRVVVAQDLHVLGLAVRGGNERIFSDLDQRVSIFPLS